MSDGTRGGEGVYAVYETESSKNCHLPAHDAQQAARFAPMYR